MCNVNPDFMDCAGCGGEFHKDDLIDGEYCVDCHEGSVAAFERDTD